jgi:two-component system KDP operon response regulator KdpE
VQQLDRGDLVADAVKTFQPDLIVLDIMLPGLSGLDVLRAIGPNRVPVIMLTARVEEADRVLGLELGADDYVTKPFSVDELLARVRVVTRRQNESDPAAPVTIGRHTIDLARHQITSTDETAPGVHLTRTEWQLLEAVVSEPGKLVGQVYLLEKVWGPTYHAETQYVRQYMAQLRRKLETDPTRPRHLLTEPGMGYRFQP